MFKEIRKKITLFNGITLILFLVIFILVIILCIRFSLSVSGENYLKNTADQIINGLNETNDPEIINTAFHEELGFDYLIWDQKTGIIDQEMNSSDLVEEAYSLIKENFNDNSINNINIKSNYYRVYRTNFNYKNQDSSLFIFQNITSETNTIRYFITYLLIIGLIGILVLIPISYFLAGRSLSPIKQSYEDQKKFIADASHELRSPLTVIQTNLEVLKYRDHETIQANKKWLNKIETECENMSKLINDMLEIAQVDNNKMQYADRIVSMSRLVEEVTFLLTSYADEKDILLNIDIDPDVMIEADSDKIRQLIRIFLDNAIKYSKPFSEIDLKLISDKKNLKFSIKDSGIGISKEDQPKIFERFFRCDNARDRNVKGTGLGLNIALNIVENYKGNIEVKSEIGKGSEFIITLPTVN